jgi:hypothetical protein
MASSPEPTAPEVPTPPELSNICYKVKEKLRELVPILFVNLVHTVEAASVS